MNNKFKTQGSFLKFVEEVGNAIIFGSFPPKDKKMLEQSKKRLMDGLGGLHDLFQQGDEVELNKRRDIYYKVQSELNRYFGWEQQQVVCKMLQKFHGLQVAQDYRVALL
jgi:hypothetical protein